MIRAAIYDEATGAIFQMILGDTPQSIVDALSPGQAAAVAPDGINDNTHYVAGGLFLTLPRPG
jgi:hypothetical protein